MNQSLESYAASWRRSLRAQNKSPRTIEAYMLAVAQFPEFTDSDLGVDQITRSHIEEYIESVLDTRSAATAKQRYMSLRTFFGCEVPWDGSMLAFESARAAVEQQWRYREIKTVILSNQPTRTAPLSSTPKYIAGESIPM